MTIKIRPATLKDLDDLITIETKCFDKRRYPQMSRASFKHLLTKGNALIKLAIVNGVSCGMVVSFFRSNSQYGRMYSIAVLPEYQGGEVGRKLYEDLIKEIKKRGLKGMLLEIRSDNTRHLDRYLKLGFKVIKELEDYYPDRSNGIKLKLDF